MAKKIAGNTYEFINEKVLKELKGVFIIDKHLNRILSKSDVIKYHNDGHITFIEFEDFSRLNPVVKYWYTFKNTSNRYCPGNYIFKNKKKNSEKNPLIIHKKEEIFDSCSCEEFLDFHKAWTKFYEESGIRMFKDKTKIGRKNYWDAALVELKEKFPERYSEFEGFI